MGCAICFRSNLQRLSEDRGLPLPAATCPQTAPPVARVEVGLHYETNRKIKAHVTRNKPTRFIKGLQVEKGTACKNMRFLRRMVVVVFGIACPMGNHVRTMRGERHLNLHDTIQTIITICIPRLHHNRINTLQCSCPSALLDNLWATNPENNSSTDP